MKVTVIGGSGLIGRRLVGSLSGSGYRVTSVQRSANGENDGVRSLEGDIRYPGKWGEAVADSDMVYHLASMTNAAVLRTGKQRKELWDTNVNGLNNVLDAAEGSEVGKIVLASSVSVYGAGFSRAEEDDPLNGKGVYARSKIEMEKMLRERCTESGMGWTIVRLAPVVAHGGRGNLNRLIRSVRSGRIPALPHLDSETSMLSMDNAVEGLVRCGFNEAANKHVFNLAEDCGISITRLVELAAGGRPELIPRKMPAGAWKIVGFADLVLGSAGFWTLLGRESPIRRIDVERTVSNERIKSVLGWEVPGNLEKSVRELCDLQTEPFDEGTGNRW